ncbi:hypothetical protein D3C80_1669740 [compost metagenome]
MNSIYDLLPASQCLLAMEEGNAWHIAGGRAINHGSFCQNKTCFTLGAATVITGIRLAWNAFRGHATGHRSHDDAVRQRQAFQGERRKEYVIGHR